MVKIVAFAFTNTLFDGVNSTIFTPQKLRACLDAFLKKNIYVVIVSNLEGGPRIETALDRGIGEKRNFLNERDIYALERVIKCDKENKFKGGKAQVLDFVLEEYNKKHSSAPVQKNDILYADIAGKDCEAAVQAGYCTFETKVITDDTGVSRPADDYLDLLYFEVCSEKLNVLSTNTVTSNNQNNTSRDNISSPVPTTRDNVGQATVEQPQKPSGSRPAESKSSPVLPVIISGPTTGLPTTANSKDQPLLPSVAEPISQSLHKSITPTNWLSVMPTIRKKYKQQCGFFYWRSNESKKLLKDTKDGLIKQSNDQVLPNNSRENLINDYLKDNKNRGKRLYNILVEEQFLQKLSHIKASNGDAIDSVWLNKNVLYLIHQTYIKRRGFKLFGYSSNESIALLEELRDAENLLERQQAIENYLDKEDGKGEKLYKDKRLFKILMEFKEKFALAEKQNLSLRDI